MTGGENSAAYQAALEYLYGLRTFGSKLGLERMRGLLDALGAPDRQLRFVHIAGTNGKGSTAAMLAEMLRAAGLRTGLYTSPHLVDFTERIQINGIPITSEDAYTVLQRVREHAGQMAGAHATFFEIVTAMAVWYFAEQRCEAVVWETGLGGRLDATNAVETRASVITTIARDHCQWLGDTLEKIAREKAGIIKRGTPVFTSVTDQEALPVIVRVAGQQGAPLTVVCGPGEASVAESERVRVLRYEKSGRGAGRYVLDVPALGIREAPLGLGGAHQAMNGALAAVVAEWFLEQWGREERQECIVQGLANVRWPGRLQRVCEQPVVLLDCAHNANGMGALRQALEEFGREPWTMVMGVLADKEVALMLREIPEHCNGIWYVPPANVRAMGAGEFEQELRRVRRDCVLERVFKNVAEMIAAVRDGRMNARRYVIAGSCYLAGEVLAAWGGRARDGRADDPVTGA